MDDKFKKLQNLGIGDFKHLNGSLIDHLKGTRQLLQSWLASSVLQNAGLYHAAYGTAGFDKSFFSIEKREKVAEIIGMDAEEIVYTYCACDRKIFWPQIGIKEIPTFKDRFTGAIYTLNDDQLCNFCELTVANELEISIDNPSFVKKHGRELSSLFINMESYLTEKAFDSAQRVLGDHRYEK